MHSTKTSDLERQGRAWEGNFKMDFRYIKFWRCEWDLGGFRNIFETTVVNCAYFLLPYSCKRSLALSRVNPFGIHCREMQHFIFIPNVHSDREVDSSSYFSSVLWSDDICVTKRRKSSHVFTRLRKSTSKINWYSSLCCSIWPLI